MKQFFKFFFASLLAIVIAGIGFFFTLYLIARSSDKKVPIKDNTVLTINLGNHFYEQDAVAPFVLLNGGDLPSIGLYHLLQRIKAAKTDDKIKGIYLKAGDNGSGIATDQQIRAALEDFKKSGKFVYAYGDYIPQSAYYVASVADSVFINPMGSVSIKGLYSQIMFFKGAMDKLGIKPEIFFCGKFKSATEPFRMKQMSAANRKQISVLQNDIWAAYLQAFSAHCGADTAAVNHWAQTGAIQTAHDAFSHHLVDGLLYPDQMEDLLRQKSGLPQNATLHLVSIDDYEPSFEKKEEAPKIALLVAQGDIVAHASGGFGKDREIAADALIKTIRKLKNDDDIKAVVMRVNSPGGNALASDKILRELNLLKAKKPLVVSMGDLAASGGYYISCQADSIFALPTTITGSIGVFGMLFNTQKFFNDKLGVTFDEQKNAPYADLGNGKRSMTPQEKSFIQNSIDSVYLRFKERVAKGRRQNVGYIDSIAQGRVWSGTAGVQNGLVDAIGGLGRAFQSAASLAHIANYQVTVFPKSKSKLSELLSMFGGGKIKEQMITQHLLKEQLGENYRWYRALKQVHTGRNQIYMLMPFVTEIK